jgi:hypothetical protein
VVYLTVWIVSGTLHGALLLVFGHPVASGVFILVFTGLGLAGVGAICMKNRKKRRRVAPLPGSSGHKPTAESDATPNSGPATRLSNPGVVEGRHR